MWNLPYDCFLNILVFILYNRRSELPLRKSFWTGWRTVMSSMTNRSISRGLGVRWWGVTSPSSDRAPGVSLRVWSGTTRHSKWDRWWVLTDCVLWCIISYSEEISSIALCHLNIYDECFQSKTVSKSFRVNCQFSKQPAKITHCMVYLHYRIYR